MEDKKIVYVHTCIWPTPSPSTVFVTGTSYGLSHNAPTVLIVRNESSVSTEEIFHSITGLKKPENLKIIRIGKSNKTPGHSKFFREAVRLIGSIAKKGEICAVITRSIGFLPYLAYIRWRYGFLCFFETHDFYSDLSLRPDLKRTPVILKKHWFEKIFLPRMDGIICLTETQAGFFRNLYPTLPCKVATTGLFNVQHSETERDKQVCYIGSLDAHKGLGTVLSALAQTADRDIKLLVIGGKTEHENRKLMDLAKLIGVGDRVRVVTWVHHSDIGHLTDTCIAGLVPLRNTPFNRNFTSPLKILDYFAHSLPVIASDLPPVREYLEDGKHGFLFEPDNPESLANALDRYIGGNSFETMSPEVQKHAEKFLWTERGANIMEFIRENV